MHKFIQKIRTYFVSALLFTKKILPKKESLLSFFVQWWHWVLAGLFAFLILYYPVGALLTERIDTSLTLANKKSSVTSSETVATLVALLDREVNTHVWSPNLPFLFPAFVLDNMPSYQKGVLNGIRQITNTLSDENPRSDSLKKATELLKVDPTLWYVNNFKPSVSANTSYEKARKELIAYQEALEEKKQSFNNDKAALSSLLATIARGLQQETHALWVAYNKNKIMDLGADDLFFQAKGVAYIYYLVLKDITYADFEQYFTNEALQWSVQEVRLALEIALTSNPLVVTNGKHLIANDLMILGFYLSQAQAKIQEIRLLLKD